MEYKIIKNLQNDFLVLAILEFIIALLSVLFLKSNIISVVPNIIFGVVMLLGYNMAGQRKKEAGTIGIVIGILMVLTILKHDIVDCLLGVFLISHVFKYNKLFK